MKKLNIGIYFLIGVLLLIGSKAFGQINSNVKAITFANADSASVKSMVSALQTYYGNIGALYYNKQSSKFRIFYDSAWWDLVQDSTGGGSELYFKNGLTKRADSVTVELGGDLLENTTISGNEKNLNFYGLDSLNISPYNSAVNDTIDKFSFVSNVFGADMTLKRNYGSSQSYQTFGLTYLQGVNVSGVTVLKSYELTTTTDPRLIINNFIGHSRSISISPDEIAFNKFNFDGDTLIYDNDVSVITTVSVLTDGANIALARSKYTLATDEATVTFTDTYTGDFIDIEIELGVATTTWTFPAGSLCVFNGVSSGDNTMSVSGVIGDTIIFSRQKFGSNYYYTALNFGQ